MVERYSLKLTRNELDVTYRSLHQSIGLLTERIYTATDEERKTNRKEERLLRKVKQKIKNILFDISRRELDEPHAV